MFFIKKKAVGLSVSDSTVRAVEISNKSGGQFVSRGLANLDKGTVLQGRIKKPKKLAEAVEKALSWAEPTAINNKKISFALPRSQAYVYVFTLKPHSKKERDGLVFEEITQKIPLKRENIIYSYQVLLEDKGGVEVLALAASRVVLSRWQKFLQDQKLEVEYFDIENLAALRAFSSGKIKKPRCFVRVTQSFVDIAIFEKKSLKFFHVVGVPAAMDRYTQGIEVEKEENNNIAKKGNSKGDLLDKEKQQEIVKKRKQVIQIETFKDKLLEELGNSIDYYQEKCGQEIDAIVLANDRSQVAEELISFLENRIDFPLIEGVISFSTNPGDNGYPKAAGAALKGVEVSQYENDCALLPLDDLQLVNKKRKKDNRFSAIAQNKEDSVISVQPEPESESMAIEEKEDVSNKKKLLVPISKKFSLSGSGKTGSTWILKGIKLAVAAAVLVLIGGLFSVAFVYTRNAYKDYEDKQLQEEHQVQETQEEIKKVQTFELKVPLSASEEKKIKEGIEARVVESEEKIVKKEEDEEVEYKDFLNNTKEAAKSFLKEKEEFWAAPLNEEEIKKAFEEDDERIVIKWLAFEPKEADKLLLAQIDKANVNKIDYQLESIEKTGLEKTNEEDIFYLLAKVSVEVEELIELKEADASKKEEGENNEAEVDDSGDEQSNGEEGDNKKIEESESLEEQSSDDSSGDSSGEGKKMVKIKETETGYLNVRKGPGVSNELVKKITPGEEYEKLEEKNGWVKIKLDAEAEGWVHGKYVEDLQNAV